MDVDENEDGFEDAEIDKELERELEEDEEAKNPQLLDETVFNKFATGELDLPEDDQDDESEESEEQAEDDSELEAYYEELGIDVNEVEKPEKAEKLLYKRQKKQDAKKEKIESATRERNDVLEAMMTNAQNNPSYQTLTRIIHVVKAVFNEKIDQE